MRSMLNVPEVIREFAELALSDRPDPFVILMSYGGDFDAETGPKAFQGGLRVHVAAREWLKGFTDHARQAYAAHFQMDDGDPLLPDAEGRHAVDALFDDNGFPDDAVVILFLGERTWLTKLDFVKRIADRVGANGRILLVASDDRATDKADTVERLLPCPPVAGFLFTEEHGGGDTMYALLHALVLTANAR